ncbi:unnamed protein product [marine sediment metagenome]|uniref:Uncharacterized protein n=1 Tax=marine sediment metagenome TaxID=412755 RepID=X0RNF0_9ZZZZ
MGTNYDEKIAEWITLRLETVHLPWHPKSMEWIDHNRPRDGNDTAPEILACEVALRLQKLDSSF